MASVREQLVRHVPDVSVAERMSTDLVTITTEESCQWALRVMNAANIDRLPVLDGDRVVGVVTDRDIYRLATGVLAAQVKEQESFLTYVNVGGVMTYAPVTVDSTASLRDAVAVMLEHGVTSVPVVDRGELRGVLTTTDVLHFVLEALGSD
jgi:CBS domain-containing protein